MHDSNNNGMPSDGAPEKNDSAASDAADKQSTAEQTVGSETENAGTARNERVSSQVSVKKAPAETGESKQASESGSARHIAPAMEQPAAVNAERPVPQAAAAPAKKSNPWLDGFSWLGLLWSVFKLAVFSVVICTSVVFGVVFGITIYRTYFAVPDEVEVPAIQGQDFAKANEMLKKAGLRLRLEEGRHNTKFPDRVIISQEPAGGKKVRKGREIIGIVSLGPEQYRVPELKGLTMREVRKLLNNNKLDVGKITYVTKNSRRPDEVLEQKPKAGILVPKSSKINLTVNKGFGMAQVSVPDCVGRSLSRSLAVLNKSGLVLGKIVWSVSDREAGEVLSQNPPSGSYVDNDVEVELEISLGSSSKRMAARHKLELFLPAGSEPQDVRVIVLNGGGEEEVYHATHVIGDSVVLWVSGRPNSDIEVYVNNKLFMRDKL